MLLEIDLRIDFAFKFLFARSGRERLLLHLLNAILARRLARPLTFIEVLNPFDDKNFADDKLSILDIKARDDAGRWYNIEMQLGPDGHYTARIVYYLSGLFHGQLGEGDGYEMLKPTIGIHIVDRILFPDVPDHHLSFLLREERHGFPLNEMMRIELIELPKFLRGEEQLDDDLSRWCYLFRHATKLDTANLPSKLATPTMVEATRTLEMLQQSPQERMLYEARLKKQRDEASALQWARREGEQAGL